MNIHPSDFVEIYDGGSTSGLRLHPNKGFTGNAAPKITVTASSGEMLVRFLTDALHGGKGWHATFSAGNLFFVLILKIFLLRGISKIMLYVSIFFP